MGRVYEHECCGKEEFGDVRMDAKDFVPPNLLLGFS